MRYLTYALLSISFIAGGLRLAMSAPSHITGTVKSVDGAPIEKVSVYENRRQCCSQSTEEIATDSQGKFTIENVGSVLHFWKAGFQPRVVVLKSGEQDLQITLSVEQGLVARSCHAPSSDVKLLSLGRFGMKFYVPKDLQIDGGSTDVDYLMYVVKSKPNHGYLELWFGPYAMSANPDDEQFAKSIEFKQRSVDLTDMWGKPQSVGFDTIGKYSDGKIWRQTAMLGEGGARYLADSPEEASVFDRIVDSLCYAPYPAH